MKRNPIIPTLIFICVLLCGAQKATTNNSGLNINSKEKKAKQLVETKVVSEFDYLDNNHNRQHAKLSPAHFPSTVVTQSGTDDPQWFGFNPSNGVSGGPWEWLTYLGTDGGCWKTRIHAQYEGGSHTIKVWMESENCNGGGSNGTFQIVDWDGVKWNMTIQDRVVNDHAPVFTMTRI